MEKIPDLKAGNGWNSLDSWPFWGFARFECFGFVDCCVVGFVPVAVENEEHTLEAMVAPQDFFGVLDDADRGRPPSPVSVRLAVVRPSSRIRRRN